MESALLDCCSDDRLELGYAVRELPVLEVAVGRFRGGLLQTKNTQETWVVVHPGKEFVGMLFVQEELESEYLDLGFSAKPRFTAAGVRQVYFLSHRVRTFSYIAEYELHMFIPELGDLFAGVCCTTIRQCH